MAGLAQKGGAVHIHCRIAQTPDDIAAIRVATGECDALIGGDLVVSAGAKTLGLMQTGRTRGVVNAHEIITGEFTRDTGFRLPVDQLQLALQARLQDGLTMFNASHLAQSLMGDSIYSNMIVFGAAWQMGAIPVGYDAIVAAIKMNGTAVEQNLRAFEYGRWAYLYPQVAVEAPVEPTKTLAEKIAYRMDHLTAYQGPKLAEKYARAVKAFDDAALQDAVATGYHKLLSYKDEYEVARLHGATMAKARETLSGDLTLTYHLAPLGMSRKGADGRPQKRAFGPWVGRLFPVLARLKVLRGTPFDPFGYMAERRMERGLIAQYEADLALIKSGQITGAAAVALAALPNDIRGFGSVKDAAVREAAKTREALLAQ